MTVLVLRTRTTHTLTESTNTGTNRKFRAERCTRQTERIEREIETYSGRARIGEYSMRCDKTKSDIDACQVEQTQGT